MNLRLGNEVSMAVVAAILQVLMPWVPVEVLAAHVGISARRTQGGG